MIRSPELETRLSRRVLILTLVVAFLAASTGFVPESDAQLDTKQTTVQLHSGSADIFTPKTDPEWHDFVEGVLLEDLPVLEELIGLPWPLRKLIVRQLPESRRNGRSGYFSEFDSNIEIIAGEDPDLLLHELSHGWFNGKTVDGGWMSEGLAEEFASRAMAATRGAVTEPTQPDLASPHRVPLVEWKTTVANPPADAQAFAAHQYNASWWVVRSITNEIGMDAFAEVLGELDIGGPKARRERFPRLPDWRALYNALDGRMDREQLTALFSTYVTRPSEEFARRNALVDRYEQLFDGSSLQPSPTLVEAIDLWWLRDAEAILNAAGPSMPALEELAARAQRLGITSDGDARQLFEAASGSKGLLPLRTLIGDEQADLDAIEQGRIAIQSKADDNGLVVEFTATTIAQALAELAEVETSLEAEIESLQTVEVDADALEQSNAVEPDSSLASEAAPVEVIGPVANIAVVTRSNGLLFGLGFALILLLLAGVAALFLRQRQPR